jgi:hypothetical protein
LITEFLSLDRFGAIALVLKYKAHLLDRELKEATINRRLAAIKSLVAFARKLGKCDYTLLGNKPSFHQGFRFGGANCAKRSAFGIAPHLR